MQHGVEARPGTRPGINIFTKAQIAYNKEHGISPLTGSVGRWKAIDFNRGVEQKLELKRTKRVDRQRVEGLNQALMAAAERP